MELFRDKELVTREGEKVKGEEALNNQVTGVLFSAGWCPPCRQFLPALRDMYEELQNRQSPFQIVFIPCDKTEEDMMKFIQELHGEWLHVPFGDPTIQEIKERFQITMVPKLIVVKPSGEVISWRGRKEVQDRGVAAFRTWFDHSGLEQPRQAPPVTRILQSSSTETNVDNGNTNKKDNGDKAQTDKPEGTANVAADGGT